MKTRSGSDSFDYSIEGGGSPAHISTADFIIVDTRTDRPVREIASAYPIFRRESSGYVVRLLVDS